MRISSSITTEGLNSFRKDVMTGIRGRTDAPGHHQRHNRPAGKPGLVPMLTIAFLLLSASRPCFSQSLARSTGEADTKMTTNRQLFATAEGTLGGYGKAGGTEAGLNGATVGYVRHDPLPNPPRPRSEKRAPTLK